jgi:hypothetical protein
VVWLDGLFYLIFTDTTGLASNPGNGAGQYVMRSPDPTFRTGVEELRADGFGPYDPALHTAHRLFESFSVDWQYLDALDAFAVASHTTGGVTRVHLFDRSLLRDVDVLEIPGSWHEGPGVVSRPDKHAVPAPSCGPIPFDVMRALGPDDVMSWDLGPTGADLLTGLGCECQS